jgi:hypothetical protein
MRREGVARVRAGGAPLARALPHRELTSLKNFAKIVRDLDDWVEVAPENGVADRRFVQASQVITVELIDDDGESDQASEAPQL